MRIIPEQQTKETKEPLCPKEEVKEKEKETQITLFADNIYTMSLEDGNYTKVSKENGWGYSKCATFRNGSIFVVSSYSGKLFKWRIKDQLYKTLGNENWCNIQGMVAIDDHLYMIRDYIWKVDPYTGNSEKVSKEGGWGSSVKNCVCVHNGKILLIRGGFFADGNILEWNPKDGSYRVVNKENWISCVGLVNVDGKVYLIGSNIYEMDVSNGKYLKVSKEGCWGSTVSTTVKNGKIYMLLVDHTIINNTPTPCNGRVFVWNPEDASYAKISKGDWSNCTTIV
jgi:hypothetical protein